MFKSQLTIILMPTIAALKLNNDMNFALWLEVDLKDIHMLFTLTMTHRIIKLIMYKVSKLSTVIS